MLGYEEDPALFVVEVGVELPDGLLAIGLISLLVVDSHLALLG